MFSSIDDYKTPRDKEAVSIAPISPLKTSVPMEQPRLTGSAVLITCYIHTTPRAAVSYIATHTISTLGLSTSPASPVHPALALPHLSLEFLDLVHLPPADPRRLRSSLALAHADAMVQGALLIMVLPLKAVVVGVAGFLAVVGRFGGGALDQAKLGPGAAVVGAFGVFGGRGRVGDVVREVGPVGAGGEKGGLDEVVKDFHKEDRGLWMKEVLALELNMEREMVGKMDVQ